MVYSEFTVEFSELEPWRDIAVSEMAEMGFESFVETKTGILGYIPMNLYNSEILDQVKSLVKAINVSVKEIPDENWNQKWEDNFDPVYVDNKLAIVAPFHKQHKACDLVIQIQPQMSFGTGHHQTTWLISKRLLEIDLRGKKVLDMGTGTGVLAIIAEKLGANQIIAPDIDEWSYKNALENVERNACQRITVLHGGHELVQGTDYDIVIANINKNILKENFSVYSNALGNSGKLILSGFFITDENELKEAAAQYGFVFECNFHKDEWSVLEFEKI